MFRNTAAAATRRMLVKMSSVPRQFDDDYALRLPEILSDDKPLDPRPGIWGPGSSTAARTYLGLKSKSRLALTARAESSNGVAII